MARNSHLTKLNPDKITLIKLASINPEIRSDRKIIATVNDRRANIRILRSFLIPIESDNFLQ